MIEQVRCRWAVEHPELLEYHDNVWGQPTRDDRAIFAAYAQCVLHAGLLGTAMLRKRGAFERAFDGWDVAHIASYDGGETDRLMSSPDMMHNLQKITCIIHNAGRYLEVQQEFGSFSNYLWKFVNDSALSGVTDVERARAVSEHLSVEMKKRGFKFAGPTSMFGLMEDVGMVNDHDASCFLALN